MDLTLPMPPSDTYWSVEGSKHFTNLFLRLRDENDQLLAGAGIDPDSEPHEIILVAKRMVGEGRKAKQGHRALGITGYIYEGEEY